MAKSIYYVASSIDGFIADRAQRLDWLLQFGFDAFTEHYERFMTDVGALVMGSSTYEFILGEGEEAWAYAERAAWVLTSRDLPLIPGAGITFANEPVTALYDRIVESAGGKDVWVVGGGQVARQFVEAGLLDELHVTIMPVVLGAGVPLLPIASTTPPLRLMRTTPFSGGAVELAYSLRAGTAEAAESAETVA